MIYCNNNNNNNCNGYMRSGSIMFIRINGIRKCIIIVGNFQLSYIFNSASNR